MAVWQIFILPLHTPVKMKGLRVALALGAATCYVTESRIYASRMRRWREEAEREFWRPSHTPAPTRVTADKGIKLFRPRMDFPAKPRSVAVDMPWKQIDFKSAPKSYLKCVLDKCLESNVEVDFDMSEKKENIW